MGSSTDYLKLMDKTELNALLEALPMPAFLVTSGSRINSPNTAANELFGIELQDRNYVAALRQPAILETIDEARANKVMKEGQFALSSGAGARRFRVTVNPLELEGNDHVLVCFAETTESHDADQMRREFVANVSHELRTPLTALMGFIETLQGPAREDAGAQGRFLGVMGREARRMNGLVDDLLSLSRVEFSERQRPTNLLRANEMIADVRGALEGLSESGRVVFAVEEGAEGLEFCGDADQLRQVLSNLIENALKYGAQKSEVQVAVAKVGYDRLLPGPALRIDVRDRGDGIAAHHLPRLTERFYRVDEHRSREMGGTGLGLAIVKHIVQRHRGRLDITSEVGTGSCFSVVLPLEND